MTDVTKLWDVPENTSYHFRTDSGWSKDLYKTVQRIYDNGEYEFTIEHVDSGEENVLRDNRDVKLYDNVDYLRKIETTLWIGFDKARDVALDKGTHHDDSPEWKAVLMLEELWRNERNKLEAEYNKRNIDFIDIPKG